MMNNEALVLISFSLIFQTLISALYFYKKNSELLGVRLYCLHAVCLSIQFLALFYIINWDELTGIAVNNIAFVFTIYFLAKSFLVQLNLRWNYKIEKIWLGLMLLFELYLTFGGVDRATRALLGEVAIAFIPIIYCLFKLQFHQRSLNLPKEINYVKYALLIVLFAHIIITVRVTNLFNLAEIALKVNSDYSIIMLYSGHLSTVIAMLMIIAGQKENKLQELADKDGLTGVYNRRAFLSLLSKNKEVKGGLLLLDVDHFKSVNDKYGHALGDAALIHIAQSACSNITNSDLFARYGGEEFLAFFPNLTPKETLNIAERIRQSIGLSTINLGDDIVTITASIGCAIHNGGDINKTICKADLMLYKAKETGRNRVCIS